MDDRILFPTDGREGAKAVFDHVLDLAVARDAELHVLNVVDPSHPGVRSFGGAAVESFEQEADRIVEETADRAEARDVSTVTDVVHGSVARTITTYADEHDVDLVAMPTHGRTGLGRVLLGSITERVMRQASVPVLTLRPGAEPFTYPYRDVLAPTDGSECADAALDHAVDVAKREDATLHVLSVVETTSLGMDIRSELMSSALEEQATEVVEAASTTAENASVSDVVGSVDSGETIHEVIRSYVDDNEVDLVVLGTHGRTGVDRLLLGSVTERVVRTADVPVLAVPCPQDQE